MKYCNICNQAYPEEIEVCTRPREKILRMGYMGCNDALYISVPPHGHITYSPTKTNLCEAWQAKMGRTPEDQLIVDKDTGKIKNDVYGCFILEGEDEAKLMEAVCSLKEIKSRESELRHLDFELGGASEDYDFDRYELSGSEKQRIESRLIELDTKVKRHLATIKEIVIAAQKG